MLQGFRTAYGIDVADKGVWRSEVVESLKRDRGIFSNNYTYEELFANDFVRYLRDGVAPNTKLKPLFEAMKSILRYVREYLQNHLNKETREAFNTLFTDEKKGSRKETMQESKAARITAMLEKEKERLLDVNKRLEDNLTEKDKEQYNKYKGVLESNIKNYEKLLERERVVEETPEKENKNGYKRTNEFRRIQEESKRLLEELEHSTRTYRDLDERVRGRYTRYIQDQLRTIKRGTADVNEFNLTNTKGISFTLYGGVSPVLFHDAFETIKPYVVQNELVDLHDNYNNARCYLSSDGLQGFAIEEDGNLISVFNADTNKRGYLGAIKDFVKEQGATHLDCYGYLAEKYNKYFGFKTASLMDYNIEYDHHNIAKNYDNPQIAFMVNTDVDVQEKHFVKDDYDGAKAYQMSFVDTVKPIIEQSKQKSINKITRV